MRDRLKSAGVALGEEAARAVAWYRATGRRNQLAVAGLLALVLGLLLYLLFPRLLPPAEGPVAQVPSLSRLYRVFLPLVASDSRGVIMAVLLPTPTPTITPTPLPTPTPTVTSTPTPAPPTPTATPFPGPVLKMTKMGIGVYSGGGGHLMDAIYRLKPSVILLMDPSPDFAREVRRWFPKAFIMGRRFVEKQPLDNPEERGSQFADYVAQLAVPLRGVVDAWMGYNEVTDTGNYDNYRAYNAFQVAFAHRLQGTYGISAVAGNDATGTVTPEDYAKHFAKAIQVSDYFGIHAYAPPGSPSMQDQAEYYTLRYRLVHQALKAAGIKHGPLILTETGLWHGWRGYVSEEDMARGFMWLSDEMDKDDYVLGQAIFGLFDGDKWQSFDLRGTSLLDRLGKYKEPIK